MAKKASKSSAPGGLVNRRARFDYELGEDIVAGLVLTGPEVRAARDGHVQLKGAFVSLKDSELWQPKRRHPPTQTTGKSQTNRRLHQQETARHDNRAHQTNDLW